MANKQRLQGLLTTPPPAAAMPAPPAEQRAAYPVGPQAQPADLALAPEVGELSLSLQEIARHYVGARKRSGDALLEAARWLHEARTQAQHGEWGLFLQATGTSDDAAERLLNIYRRAMEDPRFADAVARNWLSQTVAADLARPSTPPEALEAVLTAERQPSRADVQRVIKQARAEQNPHSADSSKQARAEQNPHSADSSQGQGVALGDQTLLGSDGLRQLQTAAATLTALAQHASDLPIGNDTERALDEAERAVAAIRQALGL